MSSSIYFIDARNTSRGGIVPEIPQVAFDLSRSGDPVATRTEWTPVSPGGASFRTHKLVRVSVGRMEFQASTMARGFYLLFVAGGLGGMLFSMHAELSSVGAMIGFFIGLLFTAVGSWAFYLGTAPVVFDKRGGRFFKRRHSSLRLIARLAPEQTADLQEVYALQLLTEYCHGRKNSFYSHEINLVLNSGERINVVDHGSKASIRSDARLLSVFLGKPVWDAIS